MDLQPWIENATIRHPAFGPRPAMGLTAWFELREPLSFLEERPDEARLK